MIEVPTKLEIAEFDASQARRALKKTSVILYFTCAFYLLLVAAYCLEPAIRNSAIGAVLCGLGLMLGWVVAGMENNRVLFCRIDFRLRRIEEKLDIKEE